MLLTMDFDQTILSDIALELAPAPTGYEKALLAGAPLDWRYEFTDIVVTGGYTPYDFFAANGDILTNSFDGSLENLGSFSSGDPEAIVVTAPPRNPCLGAAANAIASTISGIDDVYGPPIGPSSREAEYIAVITRDAAGNFGAAGGTIRTDGLLNGANLPNPVLAAGEVAIGIIHNHPNLSGDAINDAIGRYPSSNSDGYDDWDALARFARDYNVVNPSIFIIGTRGVTREYRLSDRAFFEALSEFQLENGVGLPAPVSCTNNSQSGGGGIGRDGRGSGWDFFDAV
jgi:hypothetical protein